MDQKSLAQAVMKALRGYVARSLEPLTKRIGDIETKAVTVRDLTAKEKTELAESMLPHMREAHAKWALDFERNATDVMLKAVAAIPEPKDGAPGIGWEDMHVEHDGKRMVSFVWKKGDAEHRADIVIPAVIDAGFFKEGQTYEHGDGVTFGGSYWIAQKATDAKPEVGSEFWRLSVRRGRDGKSAERVETRPVIQVAR